MKLKSPNGRQTLAVCMDTLWVHSRIDPDNPLSDAERIAALEFAVDVTKLQRESAVTIRPLNDSIIELRLKVAYGPVYGGCADDFDRSATSVELRLSKVPHFNCVTANTWVPSDDRVKALAGLDLRHDFVRRSLTLADLKAHIDVLTGRTKDATLTPAARENLERRLAQCRMYLSQHMPPAARQAEQPQPVDSNRVEDGPKVLTSTPTPDSIDSQRDKSLPINDLGAEHEEQRPEEDVPEAGPAGDHDADNDVFGSSRHQGRERRDADV